MRLTPDERAIRMRSRIVEALRACGGGPLPKSALRLAAFGGNPVWKEDYDPALAALEAAGLIVAKDVDHFVGRGGSGCRTYQLCIQRRPSEAASMEDVVLALAPEDKVALLDVVHAQLVAARESAEPRVDEERRWLRISSTLLAGELYQDESPREADTAAEAS